MHIRPSGAETPAQADTVGAAEHHASAWIPATLLTIGLIVVPVLTYVAVVSGWTVALTGTIYTEDEHQAELTAAREAGFAEGRAQGYETGLSVGEASGYAAGHAAGELVGYDSGYGEGEASGASEGFDAGHAAGYSMGMGAGYDMGESEGYEEGLVAGYSHGFVQGCLALFESLNTDRVGSWWDYYYAPASAYYYEPGACDSSLFWPLTLDSEG